MGEPIRGTIECVKKIFGNKPIVGVEIGIDRGKHALQILRYLNMEMLYLVDPYEPYSSKHPYTPGENPFRNYHEPSEWTTPENTPFHTAEERDKSYIEATRLLKNWTNAVLILTKSENAIDVIPDNLDFVYIDGNHDYDHVKQDIDLYYPKVSIGGILGGHDYHYPTIREAIYDSFQTDKVNHDKYDWWVIKE